MYETATIITTFKARLVETDSHKDMSSFNENYLNIEK